MRSVLVSLLAVAALCLSQQISAQTITATVDFTTALAQKPSMTGFLLSTSFDEAQQLPLPADVSPLQPASWRVGVGMPVSLYRALALTAGVPNAVVTVVVSDSYGYPMNGGFIQPWSRMAYWRGVCANVASTVQATGVASGRILFEPWNEPDLAQTWDANVTMYLETVRNCAEAIRVVIPDARIGGPTLSSYNLGLFTTFMQYANATGMKIDALTYHEFVDESVLPLFLTKVADVRALIALYQPATAATTQVHVNEFTFLTQYTWAASSLAYMYYLEESGVDHAGRSCWDTVSCFTPSIDGLLTLNTTVSGAPSRVTGRNGLWYTYRGYSWSRVNRVRVSKSGDHNVAIISFASRGNSVYGFLPATPSAEPTDVTNIPTQVLLGYATTDYFTPDPATVRLELTGLNQLPWYNSDPNAANAGAANMVRVEVRKVAVNGTDPLPLDTGLPVIWAMNYSVPTTGATQAYTVNITLPAITRQEVYVVWVGAVPKSATMSSSAAAGGSTGGGGGGGSTAGTSGGGGETGVTGGGGGGGGTSTAVAAAFRSATLSVASFVAAAAGVVVVALALA